MTKITLPLLFTLILSSLVHAQPDSLWSHTYGGMHHDWCTCMAPAPNDGFALGGIYLHDMEDSLRNDFYLVITNELGVVRYSNTFGGNYNELCYAIIETFDGGYILTGETTSYGAGGGDGWIVMADGEGEEVWSDTFGEEGSETFGGATQTSDSCYVIAGHTTSFNAENRDLWLLKINRNGEVIWSYIYDGGGVEYSGEVIESSAGGLFLVGQTYSYGDGTQDGYVVKVNDDGEVEWSNHYGTDESDVFYDVVETPDGGYAMLGFTGTNDFDGDTDMYLVRIDEDGEELWSRTYGGGWKEFGYEILLNWDGGFTLAGSTESYGPGANSYYVIRTDENGDVLWWTTYGSRGAETCTSIIQTDDGGFGFGGVTSYLEEEGQNLDNLWLVRTGPDPVNAVWDVDPSFPSLFTLHSAYPNPFNANTSIRFEVPEANHVSLKICDVTGREVKSLINSQVKPGYHQITWESHSAPTGVYFCKMEAGNYHKCIKLVLAK